MNIYIKNHGDIVGDWGNFVTLVGNDVKYIQDDDIDEYDFVEEYKGKGIINFVGIIYENGDLFVSFPKNFNVVDEKNDVRLLFEVLKKYQKIKNKNTILVESNNYEIQSSYPFQAFDNIYSYFKKYGLIVKTTKKINNNNVGKINWKTTIQKTNFYLIDDNINIYPFYYNSNNYIPNFLNECMIFCIDYTVNKFNFLINREATGMNYGNYNFLINKQETLRKLKEIRLNTFKDNERYLIDNLILFFTKFDAKGSFKLKHFYFHNVWEKMIEIYLNRYFIGMKGNILNFSEYPIDNNFFKKKVFYPNKSNSLHNIQPDYYYKTEKFQLIFDAKYKRRLSSIDYKQIMYHILLEEHNMPENLEYKTYSALILPNNVDWQSVHFEMSEIFSKKHDDLIVSQVYMDISKVMRAFLGT
ncbi:hypothetical protein L2Z53_00165 [Macrococcoides canis]|uniref:hypothetical protein n=1 Tax=Macrococcoides canis TaxID=1855823 RepID=UPI001F24905B|nr:hypothetical protein [Macrococcus canis]UJS27809.1 hypothetical protein L2Z53_00165 [Macrococcus canis]